MPAAAQVLLPIWKDPVCGDGNCEWPWEFPSWGRFGCRAGERACAPALRMCRLFMESSQDEALRAKSNPMLQLASYCYLSLLGGRYHHTS